MFAGPATADAIPRHRKVKARYRNVFTGVKAIRSSTHRMKKMKAMYRKDTILARNISLDLTFRTVGSHSQSRWRSQVAPDLMSCSFSDWCARGSFFRSYLANVVHGSWKVRSTKDRCVSGSRQSLRGIIALSV